MANFRGWTCDGSNQPIVGYNPKLDQVFILNDTDSGRNKELWRYDFGSEGWLYGIGTSAIAPKKGYVYSNFQSDQNQDLVTVEAAALANGVLVKWDDTSSVQRIIWNTGWLNLDGVTTNKQLYKVVTVAKNSGTAKLQVIARGLNRDGSIVVVTFDVIAPSDTAEFGAIDHVVTGHNMEDIVFLEVEVSNQIGVETPIDFELHSLSIVYRDKGVK